MRSARWLPWAGTLARLVLGGVWIVAGVLKMPDPAASVRAVRAYRLLPEAIVPALGYGLPFLEVAVGVLLVVGLAVRLAAVVSAVLLVAFLIGISAAWARGLQIDCGCFGGGGEVAAAQTRYPQEIARDTALLLAALALARWPASPLSLARFLGVPGDGNHYGTSLVEHDDGGADAADDDDLDPRSREMA